MKIVPYDRRSGSRLESVASALLNVPADGVLIIGNAYDTASICKHIRKSDKKINIGTSEWAATEGLTRMGGEAVEGIYATQFIDRNSTLPQYVKFRSDYIKRFGREPGFGGVMAYEATNVVLDVMAKGTSSADMPDKILSIGEFKGLQGKIRFNEAGDADRSSYITTILHGEFRTYES